MRRGHCLPCRGASLLVWVLFFVAGVAEVGTAEPTVAKLDAPITLDRALELGFEGLLALAGDNDAQMDQAAAIYETARRIETDHTLARRDLQQVFILEGLRKQLTACRQGVILLAKRVSGGGSVYAHEAMQDGARVEDFLAGYAADLPLPPGKGSAKATTEITGAIAALNSLTIPESDDAEVDRAARAALATERAAVVTQWEDLGSMIGELPAAQAEKISAFATGSLEGWLDQD